MVHFKLNERGGGGGCRLPLWTIHLRWISGICLPSNSAPCDGCFPFCFLNEQNLSRRVGYVVCGRDYFSFPDVICPHAPVLKRQGQSGWRRRKEEHFPNLSLEKISDIAVSIFHFGSPPPPSFSVLSLSLYIYLISPTKPITAMFLQPLQSHSASYWPFTRLPYNTHNHWISNPLLELE